jgi:hypothetical protein
MKNLIYLIMMLSFFLFSCGGSAVKTDDNSGEAEATEQTSDDATTVAAKDCDEFLDNYEEWVDDYLVVVEAFIKDPTNIEISQEYADQVQTAGVWYTDWVKYAGCAAQEKYEKRFEAIGEKVDAKMKELGLDE